MIFRTSAGEVKKEESDEVAVTVKSEPGISTSTTVTTSSSSNVKDGIKRIYSSSCTKGKVIIIIPEMILKLYLNYNKLNFLKKKDLYCF